MKLSRFYREVLSSVTDDFYSFWEIASIAKERGLEKTDAARRLLVANTLEHLWEQGLVSFFRGTAFAGEEEEIRGEAVRAEVRNPANWEWDQPRSKKWVQVAATGKGRDVYLAGETVS